MITDRELVARIARLKAEILHDWIEMGLVSPQKRDADYLFDETDVARVYLVCDLTFDMGFNTDTLPVVLSLVDQLHSTRHALKALTAAVGEQPETVRTTIATRTRVVLTRIPPDQSRNG
jgi:chaperone modulatory protein CbpM